MSTEGSAEVLLLPVADENNIVGSIDTERTNDASTEGGAEVLLLPVAAVANADIPVAQGVMWCGKKLQEKYVSACQSYSDQLNRTLAEQRAKAEDRQLILTAMIDQFTADLHLRVIPGQDVATDTAITDALRRARAALDSAEQASRLRAEHERGVERRQLETEIVASQGLVSAEVIAAAQNALSGSTDAIRTVYAQLNTERQQALKALTDTQFQRASQVQQTRHILTVVSRELNVIRTMLTRSYGEVDRRYQSDMKQIERMIQEAHNRLDVNSSISDPRRALTDAESAQSEIESLKQHISVNLMDEWEKKHRQAIVAHARLKALWNIVQEATTAQIIASTQSHAFKQRITAFGEHITRAETETQGNDLKDLLLKLEPFSQEIFRVVSEGQQHRIAGTVASTLAGLGFKANLRSGTAPEVETVGSSLRVRAKRRGDAAQGPQGRDEKLVVFYIEKEGGITYDFSGYMGDECVLEAERIFTALRARGLAVVDSSAMQRLGRQTSNDVIRRLLHDPQLAPRFDVNKRQEHLRAALLKILREYMGFSQIREFGSGGSLVIDAYNGDIGYHVVLSQEGEAKIRKDGIDVSKDTGDQLAAAARSVPLEQEVAAKSDVSTEDTGYDYTSGEQQGTLYQ